MVETKHAKARDVMRAEVAILSSDDSVRSALELFEDQGIGGAPVVDSGGRLVGVLTLRDVARVEHVEEEQIATRRGRFEMAEPVGEELSDEVDPEEVIAVKDDYSPEILGPERVGDWMTRGMVTVDPDCPLEEVCRTMVDRGIHRVFVTEAQKLLGVVSSLDVVRWVARGGQRTAAARGRRSRASGS